MALGALTLAPRVSSLTWAEASKPVIVYWASSKPMHEDVEPDPGRKSQPVRLCSRT